VCDPLPIRLLPVGESDSGVVVATPGGTLTSITAASLDVKVRVGGWGGLAPTVVEEVEGGDSETGGGWR
jgi:hypothetical protein